ncbi:MAG: hypothetical protein AAGG44_20620 [Planctomycetota bacterium]
MSIVRVGSNEKYASGWDQAFGGKKRASTKSAKKVTAKKAATKKVAKKAKKKTKK